MKPQVAGRGGDVLIFQICEDRRPVRIRAELWPACAAEHQHDGVRLNQRLAIGDEARIALG